MTAFRAIVKKADWQVATTLRTEPEKAKHSGGRLDDGASYNRVCFRCRDDMACASRQCSIFR